MLGGKSQLVGRFGTISWTARCLMPACVEKLHQAWTLGFGKDVVPALRSCGSSRISSKSRGAVLVSLFRSFSYSAALSAYAAAPRVVLKTGPELSELKVAKAVCEALGEGEWGDIQARSLEQMNLSVTPHRVHMVLRRLGANADMAWGFFNWAAGQVGFKHTVHTYYTMMAVFGRCGNPKAMEKLLEKMYEDHCIPDAPTYNILIKLYGRQWKVREAVNVMLLMQARGCKPNKQTYNALLIMLSKRRFHDEAIKVYEEMLLAGCTPNNHTYAVMIRSLGAAGKVQDACHLFQQLKCKPSEVAYGAMLEVHANAGNADEVEKLFKRMKEERLTPDEATYKLIADALKKIGKSDVAETVIWEMQYKHSGRKKRRGN